MLDSNEPESQAPSGEETPATPPRRRRAASRPAGPPTAVDRAPELTAPRTPAALENREPEHVEAQVLDEIDAAVDAAMAAADAEVADAGESDDASPEHEPDAAERAEIAAEQPPAETLEQPAQEAEPEASVEQPSGETEPPEAETPETETAEPEADEESAEPEADAETIASEPGDAADAPTTDEAPAESEADDSESDDSEFDDNTPDESDPEESDDSDPIAASLAALRESRGARGRPSGSLANPFGVATDVASALDGLAAALGRSPQPDTDDDEDADEADASHEGDAGHDQAPEGDAHDRSADREKRSDKGERSDASAAASADRDDASDAADTGDGADSEDSDNDGDDSDDAPRRRRRRRGGRRRRRGSSDSSDDAKDDSSDGDSDDDDSGSSKDSDDANKGDDEASDHGGNNDNGPSRRRRRRRRRGEDTGSTDEEGVDVVVKVREPRRSKSANDEITGIEGSTRMEAKKQRRREGRAAGRRRAPILSEAEFLARREAVDRIMLIRQADEYTQIAVMEDGVLVEHYVDRDSSASMIGNIYLGRVQNVLPGMEAAFIDIGRGRNAVLYAGEVDWESFGVTGSDRKVEKVLKSGQPVLVQVTKDPVGAKGARLTSHISIPGRYVVYSPGGQLSGISRKLPDAERQRLKGILDELVGENASVIVRTAAEGASEEELVRDVNRLKAQWEVIEKKVKAGSAPQQLYTEPDLTVRIVRDLFTEDFSRLVVDGNGQGEDAFDTVQGYVTHVAPHLQERLTHWNRENDGDLFDKFRVNEQVAKALERKVHLPSGGSLIIDRTEAMTVIDVNTGKFTGTQGNLEATVTSNNLEAAEEIVRQLRLRDIGGIIVIDFIDMVLPANRELLLRRLVECLGRDRTRHQVAEVTSLGLVQMTRKRIGTGLAEAFTVPCETCKGRGYHVHDAPVATQAPADGGDRDHGNNRRGGRRGGRSSEGRQGGKNGNGHKSGDNEHGSGKGGESSASHDADQA